MKPPAPNFLTCPALPELPPPEEAKPAHAQEPSSTEVAPELPREQPALKTAIPSSPRNWRMVRWLVLIGVSCVVLALFPIGTRLVRIGFATRHTHESLNQAKEKLQKLDVAGAQSDVESARLSLQLARGLLQGAGVWRDVPGLGVQFRAMEDAAAAGAETLEGIQDLLSVATIVFDALRTGGEASEGLSVGVPSTRSFTDLSFEEKRELLQKFSAALPQLRLARDKIDLALELWKRVPQDQLSRPLRSALQPFADTLPKLQQAIDQSVPLIEAALPLAGYPTATNYLVLLQNADEIRPGGGFIGSVGNFTLDAGELKNFAITDVYNIDNPVSSVWKEPPPQPLAERLGVTAWYLRDANWSPDFPTSAAQALDFYVREREAAMGAPLKDRPNVVLAIEPEFARAMFQLTGPVTVEGKTFTAETFFDLLEYEVESGFIHQGIPLENRKDILHKVGVALLSRLTALPASRWPHVLDVVTRALERKQVMLYATDPQLLSLLDARGWTGRAKPTQGDFLWVVDANLAALKTDGVMKKEIRYSVDAKDPHRPLATVTLTYTNTNKTISWRYTRYRSYTRVYVPEGSELVSVSGALKDDRYKTGGVAVSGNIDVTKELGKTVFGAFWSIEPGRTETLRLTYVLPPSVRDMLLTRTYRLDWPKQPGVDATGLTLDLLFGKNIMSATPPEQESKWGDARYEQQTDTLEDRAFIVKMQN